MFIILYYIIQPKHVTMYLTNNVVNTDDTVVL